MTSVKTSVNAKNSKTHYSKILEWSKLIAITGSSQILIQALGFISGILVIRLLPVHEYALYTLANTMLGTLTILADGGIATGAMALGGKVWKDKDQLGKVLSTGMELRRKFAVGSLLVATPVLVYLLRHHEASWLMTGLIVLSMIPAFFSSLSKTILEIPLKLKQDITPLQRNQVEVNAGRLGILLLTIFIFPWAFIAILGSGLPQVWANLKLRKISLPYADWTQNPDPQVRSGLLNIVMRILPGAVYYSISGQLTVWLISIFGSTEAIAQVGALSRLAMILTLFNVLFSSLIEPRFARLADERRILFRRFTQVVLLLVGVSLVLNGIIYFFPTPVLSILGPEYSGLNSEVILIILGSTLSLISGSLYKLGASRGFIPQPLIFFSIILASQVFLVYYLDLSQLLNVLWLSIIVATIGTMFRLVFFLYKLRQVPTRIKSNGNS